MSDQPGRAGCDREASEQSSRNCRRPQWHDGDRHQHDRERGPGHRKHEWNVDGRDEHAAVKVAGRQAEPDSDQTGPTTSGKARHRKESRQCCEPEQESQQMTGRPVLGEIERLHQRGENVEPGSVEPKRVFNRIEIGAVRQETRVPGQRLLAVVIGVELIDGNCIVADRPKGDECGESKQRPNRENFQVNGEATCAGTSAVTGLNEGNVIEGAANPAIASNAAVSDVAPYQLSVIV